MCKSQTRFSSSREYGRCHEYYVGIESRASQ